MNKWIQWNGDGEYPVSAGTLVEVKLRGGCVPRPRLAGLFCWAHNNDYVSPENEIVAYRVVLWRALDETPPTDADTFTLVSGSIPAANDEHFDAAIDAATAREQKIRTMRPTEVALRRCDNCGAEMRPEGYACIQCGFSGGPIAQEKEQQERRAAAPAADDDDDIPF